MDEELTVEHVAQVLQEPNRPLLTQVLRTLGQICCRAILGDTLQCEANGGMRTKDGSRRRTPGGVFFQLARERATTHKRWHLFPRSALPQPQAPALPHAQPQAPTWDEVQAVVNTRPQGEAPVTLTLIGRPEVQGVQARSTSVAFRMPGKEPGLLPKGLPPVPSQGPLTWLVAIALRQWTREQDSLAAHADDKLIITGHPVVASDSAHMLLTQSCVSMWQQGEKRQAQYQTQTTP